MRQVAVQQPLAIVTSYTPLNTSFDVVSQSGSTEQFYYSNDGTYLPDRGVTPLKLKPVFAITDPDGVLPDGEVASDYQVTWYEGGMDSQVVSGGDYTVNADGTLTVRKNVHPSSPVQLICKFEYADKRTGQTIAATKTVSLLTVQKTEGRIIVELDAPPVSTFNVLTDGKTRTVNAVARRGRQALDPDRVRFFWYVSGKEEGEVLIDRSDYAVEYVSGQGTPQLKLNNMYIDKTLVRCKVAYVEDPSDPPSAPDADCIPGEAEFTWLMPGLVAVPYCPSGNQLRASEKGKTFHARVYCMDRELTEAQIDEELYIDWYRLPTTPGGKESLWTAKGGRTVTIPYADLKTSGSALVNVYPKVYERGPYRIVVDSSGNIVRQGDNVVMAR